jgi:hypothetical protein
MSERVVSGAKIWRCRIGDDAAEAVECLNSSQRDGSIAAAIDHIRAIEVMGNELPRRTKCSDSLRDERKEMACSGPCGRTA